MARRALRRIAVRARGRGKAPRRASSIVKNVETMSRLVLGVETSCDDTAAAVVNSSGDVLGESVVSQDDLHQQWGGVVPNLARQAHERAVSSVTSSAINQACTSASSLSAIAVTQGPGLSPCLRVGLSHALQLAHDHSLPVIRVHHMEAHALVARSLQSFSFPFLALLVSGGHNQVLMARALGEYRIFGSTVDDAVGEAFDKTARALGLRGGGPELEKLAHEGDEHSIAFAKPLKKHCTCDFSYAGMKTAAKKAAENAIGEDNGPDKSDRRARADVAASFQRVAVEHLSERLKRGVEWARQVSPELKHVVVAGGVACNMRLRSELERLEEELDIELVCPPPKLCTDNGVMVAWAGHERLSLGWQEGSPPEAMTSETFLEVKPRWPLGKVDPRAMQNLRSTRKKNIYDDLTSLTKRTLAQMQSQQHEDQQKGDHLDAWEERSAKAQQLP